jgi:hypothetical protein
MELPKEYKPYTNIWISSNSFDNGNVLFEVEGNPLILLGQSDDENSTSIWLNVPKQAGDSTNWSSVISNSKIKDSKFGINVCPFGTEIIFDGIPLIQFHLDNGKLIITSVNFMPVGLNIVGGYKSLFVSGNGLSNNSFNNVGTMVGIGQ